MLAFILMRYTKAFILKYSTSLILGFSTCGLLYFKCVLFKVGHLVTLLEMHLTLTIKQKLPENFKVFLNKQSGILAISHEQFCSISFKTGVT